MITVFSVSLKELHQIPASQLFAFFGAFAGMAGSVITAFSAGGFLKELRFAIQTLFQAFDAMVRGGPIVLIKNQLERFERANTRASKRVAVRIPSKNPLIRRSRPILSNCTSPGSILDGQILTSWATARPVDYFQMADDPLGCRSTSASRKSHGTLASFCRADLSGAD
jgi:hypothetical protein